MLKRNKLKNKTSSSRGKGGKFGGTNNSTTTKPTTKTPLTATSTANMQQTSANGETANFLNSMNNPSVIERVRCTIKHAHVFTLPTRTNVSTGWHGADWKEKVWQGSVKVVTRNDLTAVLLVERLKGENGCANDSIFAVCPIKEGAVERCVDSSRYFVLRIENQSGKHMFIGVAFNERNDAFDFNTSLEDARREREFEVKRQNMTGDGDIMGTDKFFGSPTPVRDYSLKEGEKIHVAIPKLKKNQDPTILTGGGTAAFTNFLETSDSHDTTEMPSEPKARTRTKVSTSNSIFNSLGFGSATSGKINLKPSSKDTPTRR